MITHRCAITSLLAVLSKPIKTWVEHFAQKNRLEMTPTAQVAIETGKTGGNDREFIQFANHKETKQMGVDRSVIVEQWSSSGEPGPVYATINYEWQASRWILLPATIIPVPMSIISNLLRYLPLFSPWTWHIFHSANCLPYFARGSQCVVEIRG